MITERQKEKERFFSDLHRQNKLFILPNAWNVGSAYVYEKQGFKAIATTSAGIAHDLGYPDGEYIPFSDLLWIVEKITRRIDIPLSVDFERGYSEKDEEILENARKLLFAGAVGFNIEDGLPNGKLCPLDEQIRKIKILSELKSELKIDFVINTRTCTYLLNEASEENLEIAKERGNAYAKAGADCVFIPGVKDEKALITLVKSINAPINVLLNQVLKNVKRLDEIGVRRLSIGCHAPRYIYSKIIDMANYIFEGNVSVLLDHDFSSGKANEYFGRKR